MQDQDSRLGMIIIIAVLGIALVVVAVQWFAVRSELKAYSSETLSDSTAAFAEHVQATCALTKTSTDNDRVRCMSTLEELRVMLALYQNHFVAATSTAGGSARE